LVLLLPGSAVPGASGKGVPAPPAITIPRTDRPLTLDDLLAGGPSSDRAVAIKDFYQMDPHEGEPISQPTTAYLAYDQHYLYVGYICVDSEPQNIRAHINRRGDILSDDWVEIVIDTYLDHRRAFNYGVNPLNIQDDITFSEEGGEDRSYDGLWYSETRLTKFGYVALMKIPFKTLRFSPAPQQTWGIFLGRKIQRLNEYACWPRYSRAISGFLIQEGEARGLQNLSRGKNLQVIPYGFFSSRRFLDKETNRLVQDRLTQRLGVDVKWLLASNLTLDVTVNPDFSQIESDEPQFVVNRRFEVFFPEKRPFFMENTSFFETPINLLFTRRIIDPQFGLRLTGKVGPYSIAALAADDRSPGETVAPDDPAFGHRAFFNVFRFSREFGKGSHLGVEWSDREFLHAYNRVFGIDARWRVSPTMNLNLQALRSFTRDLKGVRKQGTALSAELFRTSTHLQYYLNYADYAPGFEVASAFIPRVDLRSVEGYVGYRFRPEGRWVIAYMPHISSGVLLDHRNLRQEYEFNPGLSVAFARSTQASAHYGYKRERYQGIDFLKRRYTGMIESSPKRWLTAALSFEWGEQINFNPAVSSQPFLGSESDLSFNLTVRPATRVSISNTVLQSRFLTLTDKRNVFNTSIFRSKWNYQFTRRLSLRAIGQYSNILPAAPLSSLEHTKTLAGDLLLTYLVHPGTALYVGYGNMLENYSRSALHGAGVLQRSPADLLSTSASLFIKFSYRYDF
jgi:hypothetical protein